MTAFTPGASPHAKQQAEQLAVMALPDVAVVESEDQFAALDADSLEAVADRLEELHVDLRSQLAGRHQTPPQ